MSALLVLLRIVPTVERKFQLAGGGESTGGASDRREAATGAVPEGRTDGGAAYYLPHMPALVPAANRVQRGTGRIPASIAWQCDRGWSRSQRCSRDPRTAKPRASRLWLSVLPARRQPRAACQ